MNNQLPGCCGILVIHHLTTLRQFLEDYGHAEWIHHTVVWADYSIKGAKTKRPGEAIYDALILKDIGKVVKGLPKPNGKPGHDGHMVTLYTWYPSADCIRRAKAKRSASGPNDLGWNIR